MAKPRLYLWGSARPKRTSPPQCCVLARLPPTGVLNSPLTHPQSSFSIRSPCCSQSDLPKHADPIMFLVCSKLTSSSPMVPRRKSSLLSLVDKAPHSRVQTHLSSFLYHCSWSLPYLVSSIFLSCLWFPEFPVVPFASLTLHILFPLSGMLFQVLCLKYSNSPLIYTRGLSPPPGVFLEHLFSRS